MITGSGIFFDGTVSTRHAVSIEAGSDMLRVRENGVVLAEWPYNELQALTAPDDMLRIGRLGHPVLARVETRDAALMSEIERLAGTLDRMGLNERRSRRKVVGWTLAACASLVLVAIFGIPALVERLAPLIPLPLEQQFGSAVDAQVRAMLDTDGREGKAFECGSGSNVERAGRAALDKLISTLERGAELPIPLKTAVVRRDEANAIALPGGHIYVFEGLVKQARTAEELAGVIGHEIGHVARRDGTRSVLQAAGISLLFGMLLGDFTGGGLVVIAAKQVIQSAYSRDVESEADHYGVQLMLKVKADANGFAAILDRIAGSLDHGMTKVIMDHPDTRERVAAIRKAATAALSPPQPLLTPAEWSALKNICG
jgi:Zn-dependent protease with chaperone function